MSVPDWLSSAADVLSVIGFGLTIWVLIVTHSLKRGFALRARTPQLRRSLATTAKKLPALLSDWPQTRNETLAELANARAVLENLSAKLPRGERGSIDRLVAQMRGRRSGLFAYLSVSNYTDNDLWEIFANLQGVIASLEQREKDATWE